MCEGLVELDEPPSPKFHERETIDPSLSLELSVKLAVSPLVETLKFATGAALPPPPSDCRVASESMMTAPQPREHEPGSARALLVIASRTWSGLRLLLIASISAARPATCGAAIEVPW